MIHALVFGAGLTIFVVYAFLNSWRSTLITGLSLPTSAIAAFIAVWLCGFTLNFMTLLGLSLAIGVLIDDAIVVRENIVRHMERGEDRMTAARNGTAEIGLAVTATTLSIVAVFVPVAFMGGGAGEWFRPFAVTVAASVLVSLFISFTLDPMLSAYWGDPPGHARPRAQGSREVFREVQHLVRPPGEPLRQGHRVVPAPSQVDGQWSAFLLLVSALAYQVKGGGRSEFLPKSDYGTLAIEVRTPSSTSLEYARSKVEKAAELARNMPETKSTDARVNADGRTRLGGCRRQGRSRALARGAGRRAARQSQATGGRRVRGVRRSRTRARARRFSSSSTAATRASSWRSPIEFMEKLRQIPGAVDVGLSEQDPKDELRIELESRPGKPARHLGERRRADAARGLRGCGSGRLGGSRRRVARRSRAACARGSRQCVQHRAPADLRDRHRHDGAAGTDRHHHLDKGPARIQHLDGKRTVTVAANVQGVDAGTVTEQAKKIADAMDYPPGFGQGLGGASQDQEELFAEMFIALIMGIFVMYLVLVMQFGSFTAPVAIMLSLPLSLIGVVLALTLTRGSLNLMSFIGVIMLMGLVAKNAILLLDCTREEEKRGVDREEALMHAGRLRLRPILMTTFALIAGMMPVAIGVGEGGEFYSPMAMAIIGGTIVSTLLTLLVVPSFYDSIEIARERASAKLHARADLGNPAVAFFTTLAEAILTAHWRARVVPRSLRGDWHRVGANIRCCAVRVMTGEPTPRAWEAPKSRERAVAVSSNPYARGRTALD